jgi:hypothetical protein
MTKITLPGPFAMSRQAKDEYYGDPEALAVVYAKAVNAEAKDLKRTGVDIISFPSVRTSFGSSTSPTSRFRALLSTWRRSSMPGHARWLATRSADRWMPASPLQH